MHREVYDLNKRICFAGRIYNLILCSQARCARYRVVVNDDGEDPTCGMIRIFHNKTEKSKKIKIESDGRLREALLSPCMDHVYVTKQYTWHERESQINHRTIKRLSELRM